MNENKIYKEYKNKMKISPVMQQGDSTNAVVYSFDLETSKFSYELKKNGEPFSLATASDVNFVLRFGGSNPEEYPTAVLIGDIEDRLNGKVSFVMPKRYLGFDGRVLGEVNIQFTNGQSLTAGHFSFVMKPSYIDDGVEIAQQVYVERFEDLEGVIGQQSENINGMLDVINEDVKESNAKVDEIKDLIVQNDVLKKAEAGSFEEFREQDDTIISKMKNEFTDRGVNVKWFCKCDGVYDDTENLKQVINIAKNLKTSIFIPEQAKLRITSTIDFTSLSVESAGTIIVDFNGIGLLVGHISTQSLNNYYSIKRVTHTNYKDGDISIRVQGAKRLNFVFGDMTTLELWANGDQQTLDSVAYNTFNLNGFITNLNIVSEKNASLNGWINENTFIKGRITNILFDGNYSHDMNNFIDTCVEKGTIQILKGTSNHFVTMRNESIKSVFFAEGTYRNSIQFGYYGSNSLLTYSSVTDLGTGNAVYSVNEFMPTVEVLDITKINIEKSTAVLKDGIDSIGNFVVLKAWQKFVKVILPIDSFYEMECILNEETDQGMRYYITPLNENGNAVKEPGIVWIAGSSYDKETGVYTASIDSQKFTMLVHKPEKADKVMIEIGTSKKLQLNRLMMKAKTGVMKESYLESKKPIY